MAPPLANSADFFNWAAVDLDAWKLLTAVAGLIAFQLGFFTLIGRERKSPYVINTVFPVVLLALIAVSTSLLSLILSGAKANLLIASAIFIFLAAMMSFFAVLRTSVRFLYFVDRPKLKQLPVLRSVVLAVAWCWKTVRKGSLAPTYQHDPIDLSSLQEVISKILRDSPAESVEFRHSGDLQSVSIRTKYHDQSYLLLSELASAFLQKEYYVQYLSASEHPIGFVDFLAKYIDPHKRQLGMYRNHLVVIDGYSSHFAFLDSIYRKKKFELSSRGVNLVAAKMTFAGLHSATQNAFNKIKKTTVGEIRKPTLVIYKGVWALSDLESGEQYRTFIRHVMPSEKLWGGLFTVFVETMPRNNDWMLVSSMADVVVDFEGIGEGK